MSEIISAQGGAQLDFIANTPAIAFTGNSAYPTANLAIFDRFRVTKPITITTMSYFVATASGNVDLGIFTSTDFATFTKLASTGSTAAAGSSVVQSIALTASVTLVPGVDYWLAIACDNTTLTLARGNPTVGITAFKSQHLGKAALFPLATFSTPATQTAYVWIAAS